MTAKIIEGLSQVHNKYDTFFIDLWGVVHNGVKLYPEAINVLENLNNLNKRFVLTTAGVSAAAIGSGACAELATVTFNFDGYANEASWSITNDASLA